MKSTDSRRWLLGVGLALFGILGGLMCVTVIIDPFFHYHKPLNALEYPMKYPRYQNDGIARNFEYDAIITGTSMTENFMVSEVNELWDANAIKVSYSGGSFYEIDQALRRALSRNSDVKLVIRCLDNTFMGVPSEGETYETYPDYLYDDVLWNDLEYVLNKEVLAKTIAVLNYTRSGQKTPSFDEYLNWNDYQEFGKKAVSKLVPIMERMEEHGHLPEEDIAIVKENVLKNVVETAKKNPHIAFYLYLPPYSICYWGSMERTGQMDYEIDTQRAAIEELVKVPNIKLFGFANCYDITLDLDNYMDAMHYGEEINSIMLKMMKEDLHLLTEDNYEEYLDELYTFYSLYDYDNLLYKDYESN